MKILLLLILPLTAVPAFAADFSLRPPTVAVTYPAAKSSPYQSVVEAVEQTTKGKQLQEEAVNVALNIQTAVSKNLKGIVRVPLKNGKELVRVIIGDDSIGIGQRLPPVSLGEDSKKAFENLYLDSVTADTIVVRSGNSGETISVQIAEDFKKQRKKQATK